MKIRQVACLLIILNVLFSGSAPLVVAQGQRGIPWLFLPFDLDLRKSFAQADTIVVAMYTGESEDLGSTIQGRVKQTRLGSSFVVRECLKGLPVHDETIRAIHSVSGSAMPGDRNADTPPPFSFLEKQTYFLVLKSTGEEAVFEMIPSDANPYVDIPMSMMKRVQEIVAPKTSSDPDIAAAFDAESAAVHVLAEKILLHGDKAWDAAAWLSTCSSLDEFFTPEENEVLLKKLRGICDGDKVAPEVGNTLLWSVYRLRGCLLDEQAYSALLGFILNDGAVMESRVLYVVWLEGFPEEMFNAALEKIIVEASEPALVQQAKMRRGFYRYLKKNAEK